MMTRKEKAKELFLEGYNCSQAVVGAFADLYGIDFNTAMKFSSSFGGGMGRMREVCGAVSGMFMIAGLETGTTVGSDATGKKANYDIVQTLAAEYKKRSGGSIICRELLGLDRTKDSFTNTTPESRTSEYYKKRPCIELVMEAADIVDTVLFASSIKEARQNEDYREIADLAQLIWQEHYQNILCEDQIDYMVEKYQSYQAIKEQVEGKKYCYLMLETVAGLCGYAAYCCEEDSIFLSKLYIKKECRNRGYATSVLQYLIELAQQGKKRRIWLTVNKHNCSSISFYKKQGFQTFSEEVSDIGNGYVMDDYFMELILT